MPTFQKSKNSTLQNLYPSTVHNGLEIDFSLKKRKLIVCRIFEMKNLKI